MPGLFTYAGASSLPGSTLVPGLASEITASSAADPAQGGDPTLIRDGGINGAAYVQNSTGAAGYNTLVNSELTALTATQGFPSGTGLATSNSVTGQAAELRELARRPISIGDQ